jgi:uncharacterized protein YrrD
MAAMTDAQISWMALTEGTSVVSSDGEEVGKVSAVVADVGKDIFSGITFKQGLLSGDHFVPADRIAEITQSRVLLDLTAGEAQELPDKS